MKVQCPVCDLRLHAGPSDRGGRHWTCPNFWCGRDDRGFDVCWAGSVHDDGVRRAVAALKFRERRDVVGWLVPLLVATMTSSEAFWSVDLVTGVPGTPRPGRAGDHLTAVLAALARAVGHLWDVDERAEVVVKRGPTPTVGALGGAAMRRLYAAGELRAALCVPDPERVRDREVLVVDDVFTEGSTLREVALALRRAGAVRVSGLVIARRPLLSHGRLPHR